jgi:hypothetical protein
MDVFTMGSNHSGDVRMSSDKSVSNESRGDTGMAPALLISVVVVPMGCVSLRRPCAESKHGPGHWLLTAGVY